MRGALVAKLRRLFALAASVVLLAASVGGLAVVAGGLAVVPAARAATTDASGFFIQGSGNGHGVGMSQYGALGYAEHGYSYQAILAHYYTGTTLGHVSPVQDVTVMLKNGPAEFSGADVVRGPNGVVPLVPVSRVVFTGPKHKKKRKTTKEKLKLEPGRTYTVVSSGKLLKIELGNRKIISLPPPITVNGPGPLSLAGRGSYHGEFEFRQLPSGRVQTINKVDIEDYVRGVIGAEMSSAWPSQALEAQAVAARTYVLTAPPANPAFDVYPDTRSQVYRGIGAETASTNAAESATRGQVVEYGGRPVITYFFSSSGGHTESVQNGLPGTSPEPWLVGVPDPYDDSGGNPFYRWHETLSLGAAAHILGSLVKGQFEGIEVLQHGVTPRIVRAAVVGTQGATDVSGWRLRGLFGLHSTDASFTTITTRSVTKKTPAPRTHGGQGASAKGGGSSKAGGSSASRTTPSTGGSGLGPGSSGAAASRARGRPGGAARVSYTLEGIAFPASGKQVLAQRLERVGWRNAGRAPVSSGGSYEIKVAHPGLYRVVYRGIDGPSVGVK